MLDVKDLEAIKGIVDASIDERVPAIIDERVPTIIDEKIQLAKSEMMEEVKAIVLASEDRIVTRINREITDLAEINQAVIDRASPVPDLQHRIGVVERKVGLA
ncbi:MAG: hypothetical protein AAB701_02015 [Patescibacteria group bacterium]